MTSDRELAPTPGLLGDGRSRPPRSWFDRDVLDVAGDLLGAHLVSRRPDGDVTVRITEVEAYRGADDPGSHAFRGKTARNEVMFGGPGHLYVYRHMGLHTCMNVVCGPVGAASGVLLRAGEVIDGGALATRRRTTAGVVRREVDLARGPARLTVALAVTTADGGADLCSEDGAVSILVGHGRRPKVSTGPRVGVSGAGGDGALFPWRMWLTDDPTVSDFRAASVRRRRTKAD